MGKNKQQRTTGKAKASSTQQKEHQPARTWLDEVLEDPSAALSRDNLDRAFSLSTSPCGKKGHKELCRGNPYCLKGYTAKDAAKRAAAPSTCASSAIDVECGDKAAAAVSVVDDDAPFEDPQFLVKENVAFPTGLVNKGSTCYMNALLQSLFAIRSFRQGIFEWSETAAVDPKSPDNAICRELRSLFAELHCTVKTYVDPQPLVTALGLDTTVQQDAQEFSKLFLSHVEERFRLCPNPLVASLVPEHFQGEYSYITTCKACGTASRSRNTFQEIDLNIEKHGSLKECLEAFVASEELSGDNRYHCPKCGSKQDATRRISIERLPPILNLQLLRFQFDIATLSKKKIRSSVSFPYVLDMTPFVDGRPRDDTEAGSADSAPEMKYDLFVVLIHRGVSANGGHYVCHAKPEGSDAWYEFDDTTVREMNPNKAGSAGDEDKGKSPKRADPNCAKSTGAYMLLYRRRDKSVADVTPPKDLAAQFEEANKTALELAESCATEAAKKSSLQDERTRQVKEIMDATDEFAKSDKRKGAKAYWISTAWWEKFVSTDTPGPIDNSPIMCSHNNGASPQKLSSMKCIPEPCWTILHSQFGGGPVMEIRTVCMDCLFNYCQTLKDQDCSDKTRKDFIKSLGDTITDGMWISQEWIKEWSKNPDVSDDMTALIKCEHDGLCTNEKSRKLISIELWSYLLSLGHFATKEFSSAEKPCEVCASLEAKHEKEVAGQKGVKKELKKVFYDLLSEGSNTKRAGRFFVVDKEWAASFSQWVRDEDNTAEPKQFDNSRLMCEHGLLTFPCVTETGEPNVAFVKASLWEELKVRFADTDKLHTVTVERSFEGDDGKTTPDVCYSCFIKRSEAMHLSRRVFQSGSIVVRKLPGTYDSPAAALKCTADTPAATPAPGQVKRSTRLKNKQGTTVEGVNCEWTVQALKMHMFANYQKELACPAPFQQLLIYEGKALVDDSATLASCCIEDGCSMSLATMEGASEAAMLEESAARPAGKEKGFAGTKLVGSSDQNSGTFPCDAEVGTAALAVAVAEDDVDVDVPPPPKRPKEEMKAKDDEAPQQ